MEKEQDNSYHKITLDCDKPIYINIPKISDNTGFLKSRFLHI